MFVVSLLHGLVRINVMNAIFENKVSDVNLPFHVLQISAIYYLKLFSAIPTCLLLFTLYEYLRPFINFNQINIPIPVHLQ